MIVTPLKITCLYYYRKLPSLVMAGPPNLGKTTRARLALSVASSPEAFLAGTVKVKCFNIKKHQSCINCNEL